MEKILFNLAMLDLLGFCKENEINCSGTHTIKYPRRFVYALISDKTKKPIVEVQFNKYAVPTHLIY